MPVQHCGDKDQGSEFVSPEPDSYANIREYLGSLIGKRLMDVTQHDQEEWEEQGESYVCLMFEDGSSVKFPIGDHAFDLEGPVAEDSPA